MSDDKQLASDESKKDVNVLIEISRDEIEAYVTLIPLTESPKFSTDVIRKELSDKGIKIGIKEDVFELLEKELTYNQRFLIASGIKPAESKDGEIKYYFETEIKPQMGEDETIDYKELNIIKQVQPGDKLAEIIPPQEGAEGYTVLGNKVESKKGELPALPAGKNTKPDPNNPHVLISEIEGCVKLKGTSVEVEEIVIIRGDVDYSTGNIDFNGPVIVNGDVKSGFKIKAKDDVQVNGIVEDAIIETGGNALLKMGFIGRGEGKIIAQGNVNAKFCENENIISEGDICISEYIMHCNIQTKGILFITDKTGLIVGGEIYAVKGIEAKVVGNKNYTPTNLFVGVDKEFNEKLRITKAHLEENVEHITNIEKKNIIAEIEKLESKIDEFKKAVVKIIDVVYPRTSITIYNKNIKVNEPIKYVYYKYTEEGLVAADLEKLE